MGLFGFGKRGEDVVDLAEKFRKKKEQEEQTVSSKSASDSRASGPLAFFDSSSDIGSEVIDLSASSEKRKKLAKRILEITNKLEDLSNQIYHLKQRIEVLERKANIGQP